MQLEVLQNLVNDQVKTISIDNYFDKKIVLKRLDEILNNLNLNPGISSLMIIKAFEPVYTNLELIFANFENDKFDLKRYLQLLIQLNCVLQNDVDADTLMDNIVRVWQHYRGIYFAKSQPIDDFYYAYEIVRLFVLIKEANDITEINFLKNKVSAMQAICKRYKQLHPLFVLLNKACNHKIDVGYTF